MDEHPNVAMFRKMADAMSAGRMEEMAPLLADDIKWHQIGQQEPVVGKEALAGLAASDDFEIKYDLHDVLSNDEHLIALGTATATRGGKTFSYRTAEIMHVKDGKITERWAFSDDTEAINRFFA